MSLARCLRHRRVQTNLLNIYQPPQATGPVSQKRTRARNCRSLAQTQNMLNGYLIKLFVAITTLTQRIGIKSGFLKLAYSFGAITIAQQHIVRGITAIDLLEQLLHLQVSIKAARLFLEHIICSHATKRKVPDALLILGTICMRIKMARTIIACVF